MAPMLPQTIVRKDGRKPSTLADAQIFISALPQHQRNTSAWQFVSELLVASAGGDPRFMKEFVAQLKRVLSVDGFI
jgi:hypothetical protein